MKNRISFKLLSVALAIVICIVPMLTVLSNAKGEETVPIINIHGLMASDIYVDPNDPDSELAWPPSKDAILGAVKSVLPDIALFAATGKWQILGDGLVAAATEMFKPIYCEEDGTVGNTSGVRFSYPPAQSIKKNSEISFKYDWRIDPIVVAEQLNDYIDYVLECSGCDTVKICCHSLGGVVTNTYLTIYGTEKVSAVCFNSTAIFGQRYIGELMTGKIVLEPEAIQEFLGYAFDYNAYELLIDEVIDIVRKAGLLDVVSHLGNAIIEHLLEQISVELLAPMFASWLSVWAMTADEDIEEAEDFMFNTVCKDKDLSVLKAKVDRFNTEVRPFKAQTLRKLDETASVYVIARYGYCSIPITPSWTIVSDGVLDSDRTAFGATIAPYGEKLTAEQTAGTAPEYLSPDGIVDASTCMFPEQTWFIKNMQHSNNPDSLNEMMYTLLKYKGQATVETYKEYPRFCEYDSANDIIEAYSEPAPAMSFIEKIINFLDQIIQIFSELFAKIKK